MGEAGGSDSRALDGDHGKSGPLSYSWLGRVGFASADHLLDLTATCILPRIVRVMRKGGSTSMRLFGLASPTDANHMHPFQKFSTVCFNGAAT